MELESTIRARGMKLLRALPGSWWTKVDQRIVRDTPDDIGCYQGVLVAVEWKRSSKHTPRPGQVFTMEKIKEAGGIVTVGHDENYRDLAGDLLMLDTCSECGRPKR